MSLEHKVSPLAAPIHQQQHHCVTRQTQPTYSRGNARTRARVSKRKGKTVSHHATLHDHTLNQDAINRLIKIK
eukprot:COSAG06_NODE_309_length_17782_cov_49.326698_23_plen_73_part_00